MTDPFAPTPGQTQANRATDESWSAFDDCNSSSLTAGSNGVRESVFPTDDPFAAFAIRQGVQTEKDDPFLLGGKRDPLEPPTALKWTITTAEEDRDSQEYLKCLEKKLAKLKSATETAKGRREIVDYAIKTKESPAASNLIRNIEEDIHIFNDIDVGQECGDTAPLISANDYERARDYGAVEEYFRKPLDEYYPDEDTEISTERSSVLRTLDNMFVGGWRTFLQSLKYIFCCKCAQSPRADERNDIEYTGYSRLD